MRKWTLLLILAPMLTLPAACGSDEDDDGNGAGGSGGSTGGSGGSTGGSGGSTTGGSGGSATGGSAGSGTGGGGGVMNVTCDETGEGACQNPDDCPIVEAGTARETAQDCAVDCQAAGGSEQEQAQCAGACVVSEAGLTQGCATCYLELVSCVFDNCIADCAANPDSAACIDCQNTAGCRTDFDTCSGLMTASQ
jgi:hypothetical protein